MLKTFGMGIAVLALTGCTALTPMTRPKPEFHGPVPIANSTPHDEALVCLSKTAEVRNSGIMLAVHTIVVTEWEIAHAKEQLLGDGAPATVGNQSVEFRPITKGSIRGSDYVIDGALTQLDFNTYSGGAEATVGGIGGGARAFALTAAADIRVTDTRTTHIVRAGSYAKQAVGTEVFASVFRFFSNEMFDIKIGDKSQEGLHAGIRWLMAESAYDIVGSLVHHDGACDKYLPQATQEIRAETTTEVAAIKP